MKNVHDRNYEDKILMAESTTKGIFLNGYVNAVEKEKGPEGIAKLRKLYGDLRFSGFKDYPYETERKLSKAIITIMWGKESPDVWEKMGEFVFNIYIDNPIGKTMFSLLGRDLKKVAHTVDKIFNTVTTGYSVQVEDIGETQLKLTLGNCPDEKELWLGIFKTALKHFGYEPSVSVRALAPQQYEYVVTWA